MSVFFPKTALSSLSANLFNNLADAHSSLEQPLYRIKGRVLEKTSLLIRAHVPGVSIGDICHISLRKNLRALFAQVVGFRNEEVFLMPLGDTSGLSPDSEVVPQIKPFTLKVGYELLGRTIDGLGQAIDNGEELFKNTSLFDWPLNRSAPHPYKRRPIKEPLPLGIRAIDSLLTIGKGQRIGLFSGAGVGKSSLMAQIVKNTEAKIVVVCLVGERGREVMEFINETLAESARQKCVMVVATSDMPALVRYQSAIVATAIAEWFRDQGEDVLLLMDSATRFARALREIGLALGEPPARQGYPPSVFAEIPRLLERAGTNEHGSITALYTVLVQGHDFDEPVSDELRGVLDGHIHLSRPLAENGHWPAIDILPSLSRIMNNIVDVEHLKAAQALRKIISTYEKHKDLILLGAYKSGTDPQLDHAIKKMPFIEDFLKQPLGQNSGYKEAKDELIRLVS